MELGSVETAIRKWGKADFDRIYHAADPREYFRVLCGLDYVIPELAKGIFRSLIDYCGAGGARPLKVLDLGCSYGINSALINYPVDLQRLAQRYASPEMYGLSPEEVVRLDRHYFSSWPRRSDVSFVGIDTSAAAIAYARAVDLLAASVTTDLETRDPTESDAAAIRGADLIVSTGCVGYITQRSFARIIECQSRRKPPVVASLVLRMFPYDEIAAELSRHGMVTEKLEGITFVQRRFNSSDEFGAAIDRLEKLGIDPAGKEADGLLHAELFVTRPKESAERTPLAEIVSVTSGANRRYGRRFRRVDGAGTMLMH
jgi:SAM-dependent methyltransferase